MKKRGRNFNPRAAGLLDQQIGANIRERRRALNISQSHLAELIGVTFQQVQKYEKGVNRVAASTLVNIANALDAPITALIPKAALNKP